MSAFGTLRSIAARDTILESLFRKTLPGFPSRRRARRWNICPEGQNPELLSEFGVKQPTSIDALCVSSDEVVCIESKFATDAKHGFGGCSQFPKACAGFRGPGSDIANLTGVWCWLENWEGARSRRSYWSLGKHWFRPEVFAHPTSNDVCPLRGPDYQLMGNFLFAASMAERDGKSHFGVLTIGPRRFAPTLSEQVAAFRRDVLQDAFAPTLQSSHHRPPSVAHALSSNGITVREYPQRRLLQHYQPILDIADLWDSRVEGDQEADTIRLPSQSINDPLLYELRREMYVLQNRVERRPTMVERSFEVRPAILRCSQSAR